MTEKQLNLEEWDERVAEAVTILKKLSACHDTMQVSLAFATISWCALRTLGYQSQDLVKMFEGGMKELAELTEIDLDKKNNDQATQGQKDKDSSTN